MRVRVEPLVGTLASELISVFSGFSKHQLSMFDYCQTLGEVYTGFVDGEFVCCWGLIPPSFLSMQAYLWMWAPEPMKHQFTFIRQSQLQVEKMLQRYEQIVGDCATDNLSAQRWLKWLGARFEYPARDGALPFVIRREEWTRAA
jgi:hypothetical protein